MLSSQIERTLPEVYQRALLTSPLLRAFLDAMEGQHAPTEQLLAEIESNFDPRRCPPRFLPLLAEWTAWNVNISTGLGRYREILASAVRLSQWRGTSRQLTALLTIALGAPGTQIEEGLDHDRAPRAFHLRIEVPAATRGHEAMVRAIIEAEKPVHVTYDLVFAEAGPA